jgi:hypothetical protein
MVAGTPVGEFNATDPDANSTLYYSLIAGAGDGNNSLFTLESNGTLKQPPFLTTKPEQLSVSEYKYRMRIMLPSMETLLSK